MKTVLGYGIALCLVLVGAYQTWTHEGDPDLSGATVILDVDRDDLASITFDSPTSTLVLETREDELGPYVWGVFTPKGEGIEPAVFKVGAAGETLVGNLAPFVSKRVLEGVDDSKLAELGFGDEQSTLSIARQGKEPKQYEVAAKVYGGRNRYVRDPDDGTVYVVTAATIQQLETGRTTLPDRSLIGYDATDIASITVRGGEAEVTYAQQNPDDRSARFWALQGSTEPNPAAAGWIDKVLNLRIARYVEQEPSGLEEAFSLVVASGRKATPVVVYRALGEDGEMMWYARSPYDRALVELNPSAAEEVSADLPAVLDAGA